jgi:hypothetical protein
MGEISQKRRPNVMKTPAIVGGIIDLGKCLNLLDSSNLSILEVAYKNYKKIVEQTGAQLPVNKDVGPHALGDLLLRNLDCAVVNHAMTLLPEPFDTVRCVFVEGEPLYPQAGFRKKSHIQICVRDTQRICGYFRVDL